MAGQQTDGVSNFFLPSCREKEFSDRGKEKISQKNLPPCLGKVFFGKREEK